MWSEIKVRLDSSLPADYDFALPSCAGFISLLGLVVSVISTDPADPLACFASFLSDLSAETAENLQTEGYTAGSNHFPWLPRFLEMARALHWYDFPLFGASWPHHLRSCSVNEWKKRWVERVGMKRCKYPVSGVLTRRQVEVVAMSESYLSTGIVSPHFLVRTPSIMAEGGKCLSGNRIRILQQLLRIMT